MKPSGTALALREVAEDITKMKIEGRDTLNGLQKKFFKILRKHKICKGSPSECGTGTITNNFEYTICYELFLSKIKSFYEVRDILMVFPDDIYCYDRNGAKNARPRD
jgi:hypothetical protein